MPQTTEQQCISLVVLKRNSKKLAIWTNPHRRETKGNCNTMVPDKKYIAVQNKYDKD